MTYYFEPGYSVFPTALHSLYQEYTPIVILFKSPFTDADDNAVYHASPGKSKPNYFIRISPPRSAKRGISQFIKDSVVLPIPDDGILRYKLAPTNIYFPQGRYFVEYFRRGSQIPLQEQHWIVPAVPKQLTYTFVVDDNPGVTQRLPLYIWHINSVNPGDGFVSDWNQLSWPFEAVPSPGTEVTIEYVPAVTLDQLVEYKVVSNRIDNTPLR